MERDFDTTADESVFTTSCSYDCGARCLLKVHVKHGRIAKIRTGDFQGLKIKACPKGLAQGAVVANPGRLVQPLKRTGPRGSGEFGLVSWDEALDTIAGELRRVRDRFGSESIYFVVGSGSFAALHNSTNVPRRFFSLLGQCTTKWGSASQEGAIKSSMATFGNFFSGNSRDNLLLSKMIVLWGWNPVDTRFGSDTARYLSEAKKNGTRIVSVDPRRNRTAKVLDAQWIRIRPGTDVAMMSAMAYVMISEKQFDQAFLDRHTSGFEVYSDYVLGREDGTAKTPAWAQEVCGVPADTIAELAREYTRTKPAALMPGWAPGRSAHGEQFHRGAAVLAAMTGNMGVEGGYAAGGADVIPHGLILSGLPSPKQRHHRVHVSKMYDAILRGRSGGYASDCRLLHLSGSNMLNQHLNLNRGIKAMAVPELVVVHDLFMTATARYADVVLPVTHFLEREDLIQPYIGGAYRMHMDKVLDPPDGPRSDLSIFTELAARLGLNDYNEKSEEEWLQSICEAVPDMSDLETFRQEKIQKLDDQHPWVSFRKQIEDSEKHPFPTPTGKIEIFSRKFADLKDDTVPPIPKYVPSWEGPDDALASRYPIQLVTPHSRARVNSQFYNIPQIHKLADDRVWINADDARKREIEDGDEVVVQNDRGRLIVCAKVTDNIMPGVASLDQGAWYTPDENGVDRAGSVNVLTRDESSPAGAFPSNTCLVEITKK
ncbi:MAG: molybdopterin-dependent oxidoreductase [Proteobacteria bacterium]|nr:molybdopterin-dependent oxidoreductase [Pseudomonadota bacterium]